MSEYFIPTEACPESKEIFLHPTDIEKIAYAESRLTIRKKAHNLMNRYRTEGLCSLTCSADWRRKLREACRDRFEEQDSCVYLRDTLKQDSMSFDEYYTFLAEEGAIPNERCHFDRCDENQC